MTGKPDLRIGLIGTGFMGRCHAMAFRAVGGAFALSVIPRLVAVADVDQSAAQAAAKTFGADEGVGDWRVLVGRDDIDLVAVTVPNALHFEMAMAAMIAGKHVFCEKPLALSGADAGTLALAARERGVVTAVGYNYLTNPALILARRLIDDGEIGDVVHARVVYDEDYMADPDVPWSWRCRRSIAGPGALGDLGSHGISVILFLCGPVAEVTAMAQTVVPQRARPKGSAGDNRPALLSVENEDSADVLLRLRSGVGATLSASRIAWGRKNGLTVEITGTQGALAFDQERMNELLVYLARDRAASTGFRRILMGPEHPPFGAFLPAPGHQLGYNNLKTIEVYRLLRGIADRRRVYPDFDFGWAVEAVQDAIAASLTDGAWHGVDPAAMAHLPLPDPEEWKDLPAAGAHR